MSITRESMLEVMEIVDEAKQRVQEARAAMEEETRQEKLALAEEAIRRLAVLLAVKEG
ncbi:MAG: hypothetical protein ACE5JI_20700 [Acidobacteriota bacterium]